ncbi:hypothetical protein IV203_035580 [Nitzschia inconspicua]|uniref:Uncharacterized protein n=1 Tax=Nitzschia inconspicua TaxID=303405 RepID=A0A9K3LGJ4_9STRA|nr:hypothetical protein IV203_035580 [Nitzschia inconspicua]
MTRHTICLQSSNENDGDKSPENSSSTSTTTMADYSDNEIEEMKNLIVSLSMEKTDHDRRTRVKEVFVEALSRPNGMPQRFSNLFDLVLTQVGDQVQMQAKKKFFEQQQQQQPEDISSSEEDGEVAVEDGELRIKSPEELQLWALVDMMVQSKTIVKKRNGELGSKGTFQ